MQNQKIRLNPKPPTQSIWLNPTDKLVKIQLFRSPGVEKQAPSRTDLYEIGPGEECIIPDEFDTAIQRVDIQGNIIAGLAPQLVKVAELVNGKRIEVKARPQLIEALDPAAAARKEAEAKTMIAANAKAHSDAALLIAESERIQAMAAQTRQEAEAAKAAAEVAKRQQAQAEEERAVAEAAKAEADKQTAVDVAATKAAEKAPAKAKAEADKAAAAEAKAPK